MSGSAIAILLETYGPSAISLVEFLIQKIETKGTVTLSEWQDQQASLKVGALERTTQRMVADGIDPASEIGKRFLALVK